MFNTKWIVKPQSRIISEARALLKGSSQNHTSLLSRMMLLPSASVTISMSSALSCRDVRAAISSGEISASGGIASPRGPDSFDTKSYEDKNIVTFVCFNL